MKLRPNPTPHRMRGKRRSILQRPWLRAGCRERWVARSASLVRGERNLPLTIENDNDRPIAGESALSARR